MPQIVRPRGSRRLRFMIVDDEPALVTLLSTMVRRTWQPKIWTAHDGLEAGGKLLEAKPDLIVTDLRMPGKDGLALCRWVRRLRPLARTRIIAMTAYHEAHVDEIVFRYGADAYLPKPFTPDDLRRSVEQLLRI